MENAKFKKVLLRTVDLAGRSLLSSYKTFRQREARLKGRHDLVTPADLKSERIILREIKKNFPNHQILSEESGLSQKNHDYLWIIDPLDGTTNFYIHNPLWAVSIALAHKGRLIMGAIYSPLVGELYFAEVGQGAYLNGRRLRVSPNSEKRRINAFCHGSGRTNIKRAIKYHTYQKLHALDCRQLGSAAIECAYVAAGRLASILVPGTWPWDVAAGALLVREAGGLVTDFRGHEWHIKGQDFLASSPADHKLLLAIIKKVGI